MKDILLKKFFERERWEYAINSGVIKGINKVELRALTTPEVRVSMYNCLVMDCYEIAPPHQAKIPKDNGDYRIVYVNENIDRIFLSIVNDMLFELCPEMVHPSCKSYQKGLGCGKIVQEASRHIESIKRNDIGMKVDLSKYFDSVPIKYIDQIFDEVEMKWGKSKIINVLRKYYHADLCFDVEGNLTEQYQSLKQGCAVASFLADAVLFKLDQTLSDMNVYYVRYSDDVLLLGEEWKKGECVLREILGGMDLTLNPKKIEYLSKDRWFKFLGFNLKGDKITLSKSRVKSFQKEIEKRTIKNQKITETKALNNVNRYLYVGDGTYSWATSVLPVVNVKADLDTLNEFVMDCIRACGTGKKKIGGLGVVQTEAEYTILRGVGKNVKANRTKTAKKITGYYSISCMQNAMLTRKAVYETLVRNM